MFGPKVQLNPENSELRLVHGFAAHEVSADLSIPGWWPHVRTVLETAWIGNLHNTGRPIRLEDEAGQGFIANDFTITLPINAADLDGLTAYLARNTVGALLPVIDIRHVEPFWLSACTEEVEILVKGANVWRSTRAYLGRRSRTCPFCRTWRAFQRRSTWLRRAMNRFQAWSGQGGSRTCGPATGKTTSRWV